MPDEIKSKVSRQIKSASERGVIIIVAEVPHGDHSLISSNPDLSGRYDRIDFSYWKSKDIEKIARDGFDKLGYGVTGSSIAAFTEEAAGSPQLMQRICLAAVRHLVKRATPAIPAMNEALSRDERIEIMLRASTRDREKVIDALVKGPPTRGQERNPYHLRDGSIADVYETILLALTSDPPSMSFEKNELITRISKIVRENEPLAKLKNSKYQI